MLSKIKKAFFYPNKVADYVFSLGWSRCLADEIYLKVKYRIRMKKKLNLQNPKTFNEKLQWLKLYDHKPTYTTMVDKYEAKKYVADIIGDEYIIPTLGVWDEFDDIDFEELPDQFVLKCTHDSGGLVICKDKSKLNLKEAKKKINKSLKRNYYYLYREWPYKDVKPRIIAEKYIEDSTGGLVDYKFFCFNGNVDCVMLCLDRHLNNTKFYFFNKEWDLLRINNRGMHASNNFSIPKIKCMDKMFEVAGILSKNMQFVRIDLYSVEEKIYFSEITFYPDSGFDRNLLEVADARWNTLLKLK